ncbi:class I SAM-dependent methyltransferase [Planctomycetota bacterium]
MNLELFYRIYENLPRQGPGNATATRRAWKAVPPVGSAPHILDIGCGAGKQSLTLTTLSEGRLVALDNHQPFLDRLQSDAEQKGLSDRIACTCMDMANMTFAPSSFDVIWSEGAIFILGFKEGLLAWRPFLRPLGVMVVSEIAWLRPDPPTELIEFWGTECPDMVDKEALLITAERCAFHVLDHFILPEEAWWADYYQPLEAQITHLRQDHADDDSALILLNTLQQEIDMYRKYHEYYGYVFYVMQRTD